ncbi:MAG: hypothetical protein OXG13_13910 [Gemmatimonadaceae bacterium]|nr:hypothetical protein [Gemmatimonadaceae bacterium]
MGRKKATKQRSKGGSKGQQHPPPAQRADESSEKDLLEAIKDFYIRTVRPVGRPFLVDLALAAGLLCVWLALSGLETLVGAADHELRLVVRLTDYRLQWPFWPGALGVVGLALAWLRHSVFAGGSRLQERLHRATLLAALLLVLRFAALLDPVVYVFPFLTLLWSPHALWAVALVFLGYVHLPPEQQGRTLPARYLAGGLLALCLPLYFLYALYFCQITMVHGDEGQYLRVTQSLLHDGDMDLANNLDQTDEFHVTRFALPKAPGSPEGKVHSQHPIGLSVAFLPAYWWGLDQWANPRLASALFMTVLASLSVSLLFLYLKRLGTEPWAALLATCIMAVTAPFFHYSNQLYPEVAGLFLILVALLALAYWQMPGGSYRSWGPWEVPLLGLLTLLLCGLPFLHPRLAPIGFLCGAGVLLQAWNGPRRHLALGTVGLVVGAGIYALIRFHYAFSDDWLGPLRPGSGAWGEDALDIANWRVSLPGQWLQVEMGLLNSSPIYFFALLGMVAIAWQRDRRAAVAVGLYATTAALNGLHSNWAFGFGFPARFLVTTLPVLILGLAWAMPLLLRTATTAFFLVFSLVISLENIINTFALTERAYKGGNLLSRSINEYYPIHQHFFPTTQQDTPWLDIAFWGLFLAVLVYRPHHRGLRWGLVASAALAPFLWSRSDALAHRLPQSLSPYMSHLSASGLASRQFHTRLHLRLNESAAPPGGSLHAKPGVTSPGLVNNTLMGTLEPGTYRLTFPGLQVDAPGGQVSGHFILAQRYTVQAVSPWSSRSSYPLIGGEAGQDFSLDLEVHQPGICYTYCEYSGHGEVALDGIQATYLPRPTSRGWVEMHRVSHESQERPILASVRFSDLPAGHYQVRLDLDGSTFPSFFERSPAPIRTAVFGPISEDRVEEFSSIWFGMGNHEWGTVVSPAYMRPLQEGFHPPWWLSLPFTADHHARHLRFALTRPGDVLVLLHYDGPADLDLTDVVLYRETFDQAESM